MSHPIHVRLDNIYQKTRLLVLNAKTDIMFVQAEHLIKVLLLNVYYVVTGVKSQIPQKHNVLLKYINVKQDNIYLQNLLNIVVIAKKIIIALAGLLCIQPPTKDFPNVLRVSIQTTNKQNVKKIYQMK